MGEMSSAAMWQADLTGKANDDRIGKGESKTFYPYLFVPDKAGYEMLRNMYGTEEKRKGTMCSVRIAIHSPERRAEGGAYAGVAGG